MNAGILGKLFGGGAAPAAGLGGQVMPLGHLGQAAQAGLGAAPAMGRGLIGRFSQKNLRAMDPEDRRRMTEALLGMGSQFLQE